VEQQGKRGTRGTQQTVQTFSSWHLRQEADTHHVCRPGWGSPGGLHNAGCPRQLLGQTCPILHKQILSALRNRPQCPTHQHKVTQCNTTDAQHAKVSEPDLLASLLCH